MERSTVFLKRVRAQARTAARLPFKNTVDHSFVAAKIGAAIASHSTISPSNLLQKPHSPYSMALPVCHTSICLFCSIKPQLRSATRKPACLDPHSASLISHHRSVCKLISCSSLVQLSPDLCRCRAPPVKDL